MLPLGFLIGQRVLRQRLERVPEPTLVMTSERQDQEFNNAAQRSGLAISYQLILHSVLRLSPVQGRALDIGCGSGQLLLRMARHMPGMHFVAIDLSDGMLALAERNRNEARLDNVTFLKHDMFELSRLPYRGFDLVTANNVLHHCEGEQQAVAILDGIAEVIAPQGTAFLFDLCRMKTEDLLITLLDYTAKGFGDHFYNDTYDSYGAAFSYPELEAILASSKLTGYRHVTPLLGNIIQIVYLGRRRNPGAPKVSYLTSRQHRLDWLVLRAMLLGKL